MQGDGWTLIYSGVIFTQPVMRKSSALVIFFPAGLSLAGFSRFGLSRPSVDSVAQKSRVGKGPSVSEILMFMTATCNMCTSDCYMSSVR